jgi:hypothetical protein
MDGRGFDDLVRRLATGRSRRSVLRGVIGGGAALAATKAGTSLAALNDKVDICHFDGTTYKRKSISESAVPEHLGHGDFRYIDCCTTADCPTGACQAGSCCASGAPGGCGDGGGWT